jgi:hypothetical protein
MGEGSPSREVSMCTCMIDTVVGMTSMGIIMMRMGNLMTLHLANPIRMRIGNLRAVLARISSKGSSADQEKNPVNPPLKGKRTL